MDATENLDVFDKVILSEDIMPEPLPEHIQCAKCRQIKPRAQFKRRLTHRETRRYGKQGEYGMTVLSKYCKDCQPKRRKNWDTMSQTELLKIQEEGAHLHGITEYRLEALIEKSKNKDVDANRARSLALRRRHAEKVCAKSLKLADATVKKLRPRLTYKAQSPEKLGYLKLLLSYAIRTRDHIKADISMGNYERWQDTPKTFTDFLTLGERNEITHHYEQIPYEERLRMRKIY